MCFTSQKAEPDSTTSQSTPVRRRLSRGGGEGEMILSCGKRVFSEGDVGEEEREGRWTQWRGKKRESEEEEEELGGMMGKLKLV